MEAGAHLEQRADATDDLGSTLGRRGDAGEELEERALPRTVAADDAGHLPCHHLEIDVAERPEGHHARPGFVALACTDAVADDVTNPAASRPPSLGSASPSLRS